MDTIIMANGQLGLRNGNLTCNYSGRPCSSCGLLNSWRPPVFGFPVERKSGRKMSAFGLRIKALSKEESDNRSVGGGGGSGAIGKEFEFKPSFGEYLKAMEAVKTEREKNKVHKSGSYKSRDDSEGSDEPLLGRDERSVKLRRFKDREKVSRVMESDDGESADGSDGQESEVKAVLDYRGGEIRDFDPKVGGKERGVHANVSRKMGGATSDRQWSRNRSSRSNSDLDDLSRSYKLKNDLEGNAVPLLGREERRVKLTRFKDQKKVSKVVESDEFGQSANGSTGQEDVVDAELDHRGGGSRDFNYKMDAKESGGCANVRGTMGGASSDGWWLRNRTRITDPDLEDVDRSMSKKTLSDKESPLVLYDVETFGRSIRMKEEFARGKDSLEMLEMKEKAFEKDEISVRVNKMNGGLLRSHIQVDEVTGKRIVQKNRLLKGRRDQAFLERDYDDDFEMERAAFRSFDQSNDVVNKTKVPLREIEEKIQKLGNWLNGANIDMPEWMFSKAMHSARVKYTDRSIMRVIQILGKLGNWRRVLQVIEWLNIRERYKSHKLRHVYTTALNVLCKARRPVEALNLFRAMQQEMSLYPDIVAYRSIAVTLGQAGYIKELFDVIDSMQSLPKKFKTGSLGRWDPRLEPDIVVYNAVLNACVRRKQWEGAFWVLQQIKQKGEHPSTATYGLVMEVMLACEKYNLVHEFFRKVQKSSIPNALVYKVLVNTLWREGKTDEAVLVVKDMERRGIVGSAALYYDLARCLCTAGRCQEALMQIDKICKVANKPLVVTYTGLIQACLDSRSIQNAEHIFNHMKNFCPPNLVTCNIMLKAYIEHGLFEEAHKVFHGMLEDGNHISRRSDYTFRVIPDIYTFNTMLDACIVEKRWDDFEYAYCKMLHHGFHFNANRHLRMILDASRAGKGQVLEMTWKHLAQEDRVPPPPLIKERFCMMLEKDDFDSALACITTNPVAESQAFSKGAWLNLFKENASRFRKDTLMQLMHEVNTLVTGINSPNPVLQNLSTSCSKYHKDNVKIPENNQTETVYS